MVDADGKMTYADVAATLIANVVMRPTDTMSANGTCKFNHFGYLFSHVCER